MQSASNLSLPPEEPATNASKATREQGKDSAFRNLLNATGHGASSKGSDINAGLAEEGGYNKPR